MNTYLVKAEGANLAQYHLKKLKRRRVTVGDVPRYPVALVVCVDSTKLRTLELCLNCKKHKSTTQ